MYSNSDESGSLPHQASFAAVAEVAAIAEPATPAVERLCEELTGEGEDPSVGQKVKDVLESVERLERREQLLLPSFVGELFAALCWMIQEGGEVRDYAAVRGAKAYVESGGNPLLAGDGLRRLARRAERAVLERLNDPAAVARKGEEAYRARREEWEREFEGQFIAIVQGEAVAHAADKSELLREIAKLQRKTWPFRAYVVKVGEPPPPPARGPSPRILARRGPPGDKEKL
jgi:hypothetical protein